MLYIVSFSVAVLAAVGVERALALRIGRRYLIGWVVAALVIALLGATGALTSLALTIARPEAAGYVQDNAGALALGGWRSFLFVLLAAGLLLAMMGGRVPRAYAGGAFALLVAADLWSILRLYWIFSQPAAQLYASDPTIEYMKRQDQPARVISLALEPLPSRDPYLGTPFAANLMDHDIRQVLGYHGNELGRYDVLLGADEGYKQIVNPNLWALLNARFFLTNTDSLPIPGATRVAGPVRNSAGHMAYLYQLPGDNPFAWVAPVIVKAADEATLNTVLDPRFDVRRAAIFDTSAHVTAQSISALPPATGIDTRVTHYEPGRIAIELAQPAPAGSALIASENYYPGWSATVDGKAATVDRADFVLMGVPLPAGARRVELTFHSVTYDRGKWLTLCALALAISCWVGGLLIDRRARG
jgi:hypothetical protein